MWLVMAARVHEIGRCESRAAVNPVLLTRGAVSLGKKSSALCRMAMPSSRRSSQNFTPKRDESGS